MSFSIVIPAYNESESIQPFLTTLIEAVTAEIIVVDDCSTDDTVEIVGNIPGVKVIQQSVNRGPIEAIITGMKAATHSVVVTLDADGQHPIESINPIVQPVFDHKADMVLGVRDHLPRLGEKIIARVAGVKDATTGFKAMKKELHILLEEDYVYGGLAIVRAKQSGLKILEVPITVRERIAGTSVHSNFNILKKSLRFFLEAWGRF